MKRVLDAEKSPSIQLFLSVPGAAHWTDSFSNSTTTLFTRPGPVESEVRRLDEKIAETRYLPPLEWPCVTSLNGLKIMETRRIGTSIRRHARLRLCVARQPVSAASDAEATQILNAARRRISVFRHGAPLRTGTERTPRGRCPAAQSGRGLRSVDQGRAFAQMRPATHPRVTATSPMPFDFVYDYSYDDCHAVVRGQPPATRPRSHRHPVHGRHQRHDAWRGQRPLIPQSRHGRRL